MGGIHDTDSGRFVMPARTPAQCLHCGSAPLTPHDGTSPNFSERPRRRYAFGEHLIQRDAFTGHQDPFFEL